MKPRLALLIGPLLATVLLLSAGKTAADDETARAALAAYMQTAAEQGFVGAVLVARGDQLLLAQGYGTLSAAGTARVDIDSVSTMGSITKPITATAIMRLVADGKLSTDDRLDKYFADVPADKSAITIHHLLSHQAGFPGAIGGDGERIGRDAFVRQALATPLLFAPGDGYEYSNVGYSLAAAIIEIVSGQDYERFLSERLFKPAGMQDTGYHLPGWNAERLAVGRHEDGRDWGTVVENALSGGGPGWHLLGNGGLHTTPGDMLAFHRALRDGRLLPKEIEQRMYQRHVDEGGGTWYGYGWSIEPLPQVGELIAHNGGNPYYFADFLRVPASDLVVYLWTVSPDRRMKRLARPLARIAAGSEAPELPPAPAALEPVAEADPAASSAAARWGLPADPAGERAGQLAELLLGDDASAQSALLRGVFEPGVIERNGEARLLALFADLRRDFGPLRLKGMQRSGDREIAVVFDSMKGELKLQAPLGAAPELRVAGLGVEVN